MQDKNKKSAPQQGKELLGILESRFKKLYSATKGSNGLKSWQGWKLPTWENRGPSLKWKEPAANLT